MKDKSAKKTGTLQEKIFIHSIFLIVLIVTLVFIALYYQSGKLSKTLKNSNAELSDTIKAISNGTMEQVASDALARNSVNEAQSIDSIFNTAIDNIETVRYFTEKEYKDNTPSSLIQSDFVHLYHERGTNPENSSILPRIAESAEILESIQRHSEFIDAIYIGTADGMFLIANDGALLKEADDGVFFDTRQRPWYKGAAETGGLYITKIGSDPIENIPEITFSVPVYSGDEMVAVVGADIFLDSIEKKVADSNQKGGFVAIIDNEGKVLFSPKDEGTFKPESENDISLKELGNEELTKFIDLALTSTTEAQTVKIDSIDYFLAASPLKSCSWSVITAVPVDVVMEPANTLLGKYGDIVSKTNTDMRQDVRNAVMFIAVISVFVFLFAVLGSVLLSSRIATPIKKMSERLDELKEGDIQFFMDDAYKTNDEIEILAQAFASLSEKTVNYIEQVKKITAEKERIGAELNVATRIQEDMLPSIFPPFPERKELDIYASMNPAKEVGGDFYDFFFVDENHLALVMADVSGKGVPAALFMVISKTLIKNRALLGGSPSQILADVNKQLCEGNKADMFVTVWLAIIDVTTGEGIAANAGHEYPALCRKGEKFELVQTKHSPAVAIMDGIKFREHEFKLEKGDMLFIYTDGVPEAVNEGNEMFGAERMLDVLNANIDSPVEKIPEQMKLALDTFAGTAPQFDDTTMLAFKYKGL